MIILDKVFFIFVSRNPEINKRMSSTKLVITILITLLTTAGCSRQVREKDAIPIAAIDAYRHYTQQPLPDSLTTTIENIRKRAEEEEDFDTQMFATLILLNRNMSNGDYHTGITLSDDFLRRVAEYGDSTKLTRALYNTGRQYSDMGMSYIALEHFLRAKETAVTELHRYHTIFAVAEMSRVLHDEPQRERIDEQYQMALDIARNLNDSAALGQCLFGCSQMYFDALGAHKHKQAPLSKGMRDSINMSMQLLNESLTFSPIFQTYFALGLCHAARGETDTAKRYIDQGMDMGREEAAITGMNVETSFLICAGRYAEAIELNDKAYALSKALNRDDNLRNSTHLMYYAYKYAGDMGKALEALEEYHSVCMKYQAKMIEQRINILQARHNVQLKDEQLTAERQQNRLYRKGLTIISASLAGVIVLLVVAWLLYAKIKTAYKALAKKNKEWQQNLDSTNHARRQGNGENRATKEQIALMEKLDCLLRDEKIYTRAGLTLDVVADMLGTNRSVLSGAVNLLNGKNFPNHINEFRVREAIKELSDEQYDKFTLEMIAANAGFSNRASFYQAFKQTTGLTPATFRKNR